MMSWQKTRMIYARSSTRSALRGFCGVCAGMCIGFVLFSVVCVVPVCADEYEIIIEKNLFHDQRQKWEMERPKAAGDSASGPGSQEQRDIAQINLFGTVIKDSRAYAVMRMTAPPPQRGARAPAQRPGARAPAQRPGAPRTAQAAAPAQDSKRPYTVGDHIGGFLVVEIRPASVLLQDIYDNNRYEVFLNDGQTERSAVRTEIPEEKPAAPAPRRPAERRQPQRRPRPGADAQPTPDQAADFMRQRFERDMQVLRETNDPAAAEHAARDWEKLEPMLSALDDSSREDLQRLKEDFERMRR